MRRRTRCLPGLLALYVTGAPVPLLAQAAPELMTAVPESPAFTFMGTSPSLVERPGGLRDLGAALLSGVGDDGQARQGFALDASVWTLVPDLSISLSDYQDSRLKFMLANTQLSLGTVRAAADSGDTDAAAGLRISLLDRSDPMTDTAFTRALGDAILGCAPAGPGATASAACVDSVTSTSFAEWTEANWNKARLSLAVASGVRLAQSRFGQREFTGFDAWLAGGLPVGGGGQLVGQVRYKDRATMDSVSEHTAWNVGARLLLGSPTWNGFIEYAQEGRSGPDGELEVGDLDERAEAWSAGLEFRMTAHTWISTGIGKRFSALGDPDEAVVFGNIRWGVTSQARIEQLRTTP